MSCKILSVVRVRPEGAHSHNLFRIAILCLYLMVLNLSAQVECDEVYLTARHKGKPEEVKIGAQRDA